MALSFAEPAQATYHIVDTLVPPNPPSAAGDGFGASLALSRLQSSQERAQVAVVGAPLTTTGGRQRGAVYVYTSVNHNTWSAAEVLQDPTRINGWHFGQLVAADCTNYSDPIVGITPSTIVVAAENERKLLFFDNSLGPWTMTGSETTLPTVSSGGIDQAIQIAIQGNTAIVLAKSGFVYIYKFSPASRRWFYAQTLRVGDFPQSGRYATYTYISINGNDIALSAFGPSFDQPFGALFQYRRPNASQNFVPLPPIREGFLPVCIGDCGRKGNAIELLGPTGGLVGEANQFRLDSSSLPTLLPGIGDVQSIHSVFFDFRGLASEKIFVAGNGGVAYTVAECFACSPPETIEVISPVGRALAALSPAALCRTATTPACEDDSDFIANTPETMAAGVNVWSERVLSSTITYCCTASAAGMGTVTCARASTCPESRGNITVTIPATDDGAAAPSMTIVPGCNSVVRPLLLRPQGGAVCAEINFSGHLTDSYRACFPCSSQNCLVLACDPLPLSGSCPDDHPKRTDLGQIFCCSDAQAGISDNQGLACVNGSGFSSFVAAPPSDFVDTDGDLIIDVVDNCPSQSNILQEDQDGDGVGTACDNCPAVPNRDQSDTTGSSVGDACNCALGVPQGPSGAACPAILVPAVPAIQAGTAGLLAALLAGIGALTLAERRRRGRPEV